MHESMPCLSVESCPTGNVVPRRIARWLTLIACHGKVAMDKFQRLSSMPLPPQPLHMIASLFASDLPCMCFLSEDEAARKGQKRPSGKGLATKILTVQLRTASSVAALCEEEVQRSKQPSLCGYFCGTVLCYVLVCTLQGWPGPTKRGIQLL